MLITKYLFKSPFNYGLRGIVSKISTEHTCIEERWNYKYVRVHKEKNYNIYEEVSMKSY